MHVPHMLVVLGSESASYASPPKSIGRGLLSMSADSSNKCVESSTPEKPLSPPKSLSRIAHCARLPGACIGHDDAHSTPPKVVSSEMTSLTPRRSGLRNTPARQERALAAAQSVANNRTPSGVVGSMAGAPGPIVHTPGPDVMQDAPMPAAPKTPRSAFKGSRAAANAADATLSNDDQARSNAAVADAVCMQPERPVLKLEGFPNTFRQGVAAEQLRLLFSTLVTVKPSRAPTTHPKRTSERHAERLVADEHPDDCSRAPRGTRWTIRA